MGRRPAQTPWMAFRQRLTNVSQGHLESSGESGGPGRAVFTPRSIADVRQAHALCVEYGVVLALAGMLDQIADSGQSLLCIDPVELTTLTPLESAPLSWRAEPGCTVGQLAEIGLTQFEGLPAGQTLAQWIAQRARWAPGECAASGVLSANVLLADGVRETLGAFGEADVKPLQSSTVQHLIPALFQLAANPEIRACRDLPVWPARYRLDALLPQAPQTVNLAHLLLGHAGTLAWVESVVLTPMPSRPGSASTLPQARIVSSMHSQMKTLFDPKGLFPGLAVSALSDERAAR